MENQNKHTSCIIPLTEDQCDLLNGIFNGVIILEQAFEDKNFLEVKNTVEQFRSVANSKRFDEFLNLFNRIRHEHGFCKEPNCPSTIKVKPIN